MKTPIVSVLMPIFNTELTVLKDAIESILSQTFTEFEYLIVNDSPKNDRLDELVLSYDDSRIIYVKNEKNEGLEQSTNKLIQMSRGKYLAIFDHDDISLPYRLEKEVDYLEMHPDVGVCSAQFRVFGKENWVSDNPTNYDEVKNTLESRSCVSHSASMFRKSVLVENHIAYEKEFFPAASYRIITQLALVTNIHNLSDVLLDYRMGENNTSVIHDEKRKLARSKISTEYAKSRKVATVKKLFKFDSVKMMDVNLSAVDHNYFRAVKDKKSYFIKSGHHGYEHEFKVAKKMFDRNQKYFVKPTSYYAGDTNYFVTEWTNGVGLDEYLKKNKPSKKQKESFIRDLSEIHAILRREGVVHRDLIPRNFMVTEEHLVLIDFYWAVDKDAYEEYDYIKGALTQVRLLGESFAAGSYKWDDAFSLFKIAEYILGEDVDGNKVANEIAALIGDVVISPSKNNFVSTIEMQEQEIGRKIEMIDSQDRAINHERAIIKELERKILAKDAALHHYQRTIQDIKESKSYRLGRNATFPYRLVKIVTSPGKVKNKLNTVKTTSLRKSQKLLSIPADRKIERIYFDELKKVKKADNDKAIILHLYYLDMWPYFAKKLNHMVTVGNYDLFVNVPHRNSKDAQHSEKLIQKDFPNAVVLHTPNKGRDVLSFVRLAKELRKNGYEYVLKLHSKKSPQRQDGKDWADEIIRSLVATNDKKMSVIERAFDNQNTAIIGPKGSYVSLTTFYNDNQPKIHWLLSEIYNKEDADNINANNDSYGFFAGTMFWVRLSAIESVINLPLTANNFPPESAQLDGTVAHALERLFCIVPEYDNMDIYEAERDSVRQISHKTTFIPEWSDYYHEK